MSVVEGTIHIPLCLNGSFPWFKLNFLYPEFNVSESRIGHMGSIYFSELNYILHTIYFVESKKVKTYSSLFKDSGANSIT